MANLTFADTPEAVLSECASPSTAQAFEGLLRDEHKSLARSIFALRRAFGGKADMPFLHVRL